MTLDVIPAPSPNFDARTAPPDMIVMHYTGMQTGEAALARLRDPEAKVSSHYLVEEDGRIFSLVAEERRAWHAGRGSWRGETNCNAVSVGIEIVNPGHEFGYRPFPDEQVAALIPLIADIKDRHGIGRGNIVGHSDIAPSRKEDPGELFPWDALAKRRLADFVPPAEMMAWLDGRRLEAVIHLGAISETTATDGDLVIETNFRLSMRLLDWCTANHTPLIYASSAATYGDGEQGFADDYSMAALKKLRPMNLYGWSKHLFDMAVAERAARGEPLPPQWAGLKFFNVFGPNEYHKGTMMSVLARRFDDIRDGRPVQLFKSHREGIADGDQRRDFIPIESDRPVRENDVG